MTGTTALLDVEVAAAPPQHEPKLRYVGRTLEVARQAGHRVLLVELLPGIPVEFEPRCAADIHCFDIHKFGMNDMVGWVSQAQRWRIETERLPLCVVVVAEEKRLTVEELWRVSHELEPAGAIFHSWPEKCASFSDAFELLGESIGSAYKRSTALDLALAGR